MTSNFEHARPVCAPLIYSQWKRACCTRAPFTCAFMPAPWTPPSWTLFPDKALSLSPSLSFALTLSGSLHIARPETQRTSEDRRFTKVYVHHALLSLVEKLCDHSMEIDCFHVLTQVFVGPGEISDRRSLNCKAQRAHTCESPVATATMPNGVFSSISQFSFVTTTYSKSYLAQPRTSVVSKPEQNLVPEQNVCTSVLPICTRVDRTF